MNPLLALTVTAALAGPVPVASTSDTEAAAFASSGAKLGQRLLACASTPSSANTAASCADLITPRPSKPAVAATAAARAFKGDSLANGAVIGGVITGVGMGGFLYWLCNALDDTGGDANCAGPALLYGALFGLAGGAVGAGIDALIDRKPPIFEAPRRTFTVGFRF